MWLPKFSIEQPVLVNLSSVLVLIAGIAAFISLPKEEWSAVEINTATVETIYRGASPEEMEQLITRELEEELVEIQGESAILNRDLTAKKDIQVNQGLSFQPGQTSGY